MSVSVRLAAAGLAIIAGFAPVRAQMLPPEPPAPMPPATTLPSMRDDKSLGAEPPVIMPPASTLPSFRAPDPAGR
jgi:hypothetical protein